jgi:PAS domain S-box-containing protein
MELILSNVADGVFTVDADFRITSFNRAAEEITGFGEAQAVGKFCHEIFRTPICDQDCPLRQSLRTGRRVKNFEIDILTRQGRRQTISVSTAPLIDRKGEFLGGVETFRDLTPIKRLQQEIAGSYSFQDIISKSPQMRQIFQTLPNIAQSDATVLIQGASGTGKELFTRAIHNLSPRSNGPLVTVNCGALPDTLLESELFGHVRGAFTDAKNDRIGRFQAAEGGTIFLDEVGDTPLPVQVKLLRVLENKEVQPLGSEQMFKVDARVVAATNQDLERLVEERRFREDLYYRLNVILIQIPDLLDRTEDIPLFVDHFIEKFNQRRGRQISGVNEEAMAVLMGHSYPGNVRELENAIEHACIVATGKRIGIVDLPTYLVAGRGSGEGRAAIVGGESRGRGSWIGRRGPERERSVITRCLERNLWSIPRAALELGVHRTTLWRKVKRLGIERP